MLGRLETRTFLGLSALKLVGSCLVPLEDCIRFTRCDSGCGALFSHKGLL